jgi:hypothetical protein
MDRYDWGTVQISPPDNGQKEIMAQQKEIMAQQEEPRSTARYTEQCA